MPTRIAISVLALLLLVGTPHAWGDDGPPEDAPLAAVAFLVGEFHGEGKHPAGTYQETLTGRWILGGTALEIRSKSTMGNTTVFEDLRVISFDPQADQLRLRQWAGGTLRVFATVSSDDPSVVFEQSAHEGPPSPAWQYTFTPTDGGGFAYTVRTRKGEAWEHFLGGTLAAQLKDPGKGGGLGIRSYNADVAGMPAEVHHPDGAGPYPVIVFSPGGGAQTFQGYGPYGRWFATWGFITVIVAFNDQDATERAPKFSKAIDWVVAESTRDGSPLHGMVDTERLAVAGHSRGAFAALVAARLDPRVRAVLALAPSGPQEATDGEGKARSLIVIGDGDKFLETARKAHACQPGERFLIEIAGLDHMLQQRGPLLRLVARSTAFLNYALTGDARYRAPLVEAGEGLTATSAK